MAVDHRDRGGERTGPAFAEEAGRRPTPVRHHRVFDQAVVATHSPQSGIESLACWRVPNTSRSQKVRHITSSLVDCDQREKVTRTMLNSLQRERVGSSPSLLAAGFGSSTALHHGHAQAHAPREGPRQVVGGDVRGPRQLPRTPTLQAKNNFLSSNTNNNNYLSDNTLAARMGGALAATPTGRGSNWLPSWVEPRHWEQIAQLVKNDHEIRTQRPPWKALREAEGRNFIVFGSLGGN